MRIATMATIILTFMYSYNISGEETTMRLGLVGLDTSHVISFITLLNDPEHANHVPGAKIVAGYIGGSDDFAPSYERIENFTQRLVEDWNITLYDTIEELCANVDAVFLTSVDGRQHLEQARPIIAAGLPFFVDKPFTGSLSEAIELFELADANDVPLFTTSALRFWEPVVELGAMNNIQGAATVGPCPYQPGLPDLYWYGIHGIEVLFSIMGPDCIEVTHIHTKDTDLITGKWADGRVGTYRGIRNAASPFRLTVFGSDEIIDTELSGSYQGLMEACLELFRTGKPAVSREETLAIFAFMEAAAASKAQGGIPVTLKEAFDTARN